MIRIRVIPILLINNNKLIKTIKFNKATYIGDPINAVKIFNEKEVDEIIIVDMSPTIEEKNPSYKLITELASECFMPMCYGGGITTIDEIKKIINSGVEKVAINSAANSKNSLITDAANVFGSQSVVVSIDVKKNWLGKYTVFTHSGKVNTKKDPLGYAKEMENRGAGEILLNSIDRDGTFTGYDTELIQYVSQNISIPVIACGGAGKMEDFLKAVNNGASAVAAGSLFAFHGKHRAVLINFPSQEELKETFSNKF